MHDVVGKIPYREICEISDVREKDGRLCLFPFAGACALQLAEIENHEVLRVVDEEPDDGITMYLHPTAQPQVGRRSPRNFAATARRATSSTVTPLFAETTLRNASSQVQKAPETPLPALKYLKRGKNRPQICASAKSRLAGVGETARIPFSQ